MIRDLKCAIAYALLSALYTILHSELIDLVYGSTSGIKLSPLMSSILCNVLSAHLHAKWESFKVAGETIWHYKPHAGRHLNLYFRRFRTQLYSKVIFSCFGTNSSLRSDLRRSLSVYSLTATLGTTAYWNSLLEKYSHSTS